MVLRTTRGQCSQHSDRPRLAHFAWVVVPVIRLRNAFNIYGIVLLYVNSQSCSATSQLATTSSLSIFGQFADITLSDMILYGAWQTGWTVRLFGSHDSYQEIE